MNRTQRAIDRHLKALHGETFDIAGKFDEEILNRTWTKAEVVNGIKALKAWNMKEAAIFVRPAVQTGTVLLDDLARERINVLVADGLAPACVVETSPGNYQVWIRLVKNPAGNELDGRLVTRAIRIMVKRYGADLSSADWRHFGRLGGFTNRKPKYRMADGNFPYVLVREASGEVAAKGRAVLLETMRALAAEAKSDADSSGFGLKKGAVIGSHAERRQAILMTNSDKPWAPNPDENIIDWMMVCDALKEGWPAEAVAEMLTQRADLHLKHRVEDYCINQLNSERRDFLCRAFFLGPNYNGSLLEG